MHNSGKRILFPLLILVSVMPLWSQGFFSSAARFASLPDAVDLRVSLRTSITASAWTARRLPSDIYTSETAGIPVRFQVKTQGDAFYLLLTNRYQDSFPLYSAGSYIIKRSLDDGKFVQAKIFLKNDPDCFIRLFPFKERSKIEIWLYGSLIYREVVVPSSFEELLFSPFSRIVALTEQKIDWQLLLPPDHPAPEVTLNTVASLRKAVELLPDMDDGALDDQGRFIYIESGERAEAGGFNCSGFAKFAADGLYLPLHGSLMPVEPLKQKHPDLRGDPWSARYEDERDPFFGLDWTRNIAAFIATGDVKASSYEKYDVRRIPWSVYAEDVGFPMQEIKSVLYYEAKENPGSMYLASVNLDYGTDPVLRQHVHVAVLLPYIKETGDLSVAVFERNRETSVSSLLERYPGGHIHLVRIPLNALYSLPALPGESR